VKGARTAAPARERFVELLDEHRVIHDPLERRLYARDGSIAQGTCGLVVLPETTAEVACIRLAAELGLAVVRADPARVLPGAPCRWTTRW